MLRSLGAFCTVVGLGIAGALVSTLVLRREVPSVVPEVQALVDASGTKVYPFAPAVGVSERLVDRLIGGQTLGARVTATRGASGNISAH